MENILTDVEFTDAADMLNSIQEGTDFWNPIEKEYVISNDDSGAICRYTVDEEKAGELMKLSEENDGEYWSTFLGTNGSVFEDMNSENYRPGNYSNFEYCKKYYSCEGWKAINY